MIEMTLKLDFDNLKDLELDEKEKEVITGKINQLKKSFEIQINDYITSQIISLRELKEEIE